MLGEQLPSFSSYIDLKIFINVPLRMVFFKSSYTLFINFNIAGSSGETLSNLSAGVHHIIFKFIPTKFSDAYIVSKTCQFKIKPTGV